MGHIYAFMTGDRTLFTGEGQDDYTQEFGWVDPTWSRTELHESRNDVRPLISEDEQCEDLADWVRDLVGGGAWHDNGDGSFHLQDEHVADDGASWTYAVHFKRKYNHPTRGWTEDAWHPVADGGITL